MQLNLQVDIHRFIFKPKHLFDTNFRSKPIYQSSKKNINKARPVIEITLKQNKDYAIESSD